MVRSMSTENSCLWLAVKVLSGSKTLFGSRIVPATCCENCKPVVIILSDGGPDHRLCYGSVKVSMIALFLKLNLDILVCMQMCPYQSWTNPAERVMSTLNLALQKVSLMRDKMDDEMERAI